MPKSPPVARKETPGQKSLHSFFGPSSSSSSNNNNNNDGATSHAAPTAKAKYRLNTTQVKKYIPTDDNDDNNDASLFEYVTGRLMQFHAEDQTYQVKLDRDENRETWTAAEVEWGVLLHQTIGVVGVAKWFDQDLYRGTVVHVVKGEEEEEEEEEQQQDGDGAVKSSLLYRIQYEDGDEEDFDQTELEEGKQLRKEQDSKKGNRKKATKKVADKRKAAAPAKAAKRAKVEKDDDEEEEEVEAVDEDEEMEEADQEKESGGGRGGRSRRKSAVKSYALSDSEEEEFEFSDDEEVAKNRAKKRSKPAPKKKKAKSVESDDESEFDSVGDAVTDSDDDLDDEVLMVEDSESEPESEEDIKPKAKRSRGGAKKTKEPKEKIPKAAGRGKSNKNATNQELQDEFDQKLAKELKVVKPKNNPQSMPDEPFVDPVGVDPTHGIVEGIVSTQVRKVGSLLLGAIKHNQETGQADGSILGELTFPIRLQTACSGTDAPSIGLGLIKETLDKMYAAESKSNKNSKTDGKKDGHGFNYKHEMSCEIEPFKQAYIGRNFPGVPLFPDITKLTASEEVLDVYGRPQSIPAGNLFVAGTSCKDFSMLKTRDRLDIEDKGTSGETFLAAVEFLDQKQPPLAIFENVDGAPWGKMQEYIRGRLSLAERNDTKAIKDASKKADADNLLKFSVDESGRYVAEEIPRQVGIRAGSVVEGFVKGGHDSDDVVPLVAPDNSTSKLVTLGEMAKRHKINLEQDTLVMEKKARYCTHLCKVDTKEYGLPQTRNRKYLFIWRSDDPDDDLGEYFQEILDHLKTPLLYSMDAFLLPETHDRIRCFREALRSGPGLLVKRERAKELNFWDYEEARIKDVILHYAFREINGIEEKARWMTGWDTRGRKLLAAGLWPELVDCWNMRRLDMIDCFAAAATRDAIARDPLHHSFTWDLSQNVTRAPFRNANVGVSGCVTPGGELLLAHKGRTLMGYEKLLLQGIPFSRLLLGPESEVQLSDLAGNAMSVPVICATMLSALCAPELRRQRTKERKIMLKNFALSQKYDSANGAVLAVRGDLFQAKREKDPKVFKDVFGKIAKDLALDAFRSSVLCTCESSGTTTSDEIILQCNACGWGVCHSCSDRYRVSPHKLCKIDVCGGTERPDSHAFERKLRCAVPSVLRLGEGWEDELEHGEGLESYSFQLQQVDRKRGNWSLVYGAWEDHGAARQVAEIRVVIGKLGRLDPDVGVAAFVRCYAPAISHVKPLRGRLKDSARLVFKVQDKEAHCWEFPDAPSTQTLKIAGDDPCDSPRVQVGLNDAAAKALKASKIQNRYIPKCQSKSRNNYLAYHPSWKTYPGTIVISGDSNEQVNGKYRKMDCQQTIVLSSLWRRDAVEDKPAMYIYIRPDVVRAELDVAVISPTPAYADGLEVCELQDWIPENTLKESTHKTKATFIKWRLGPGSLKVEVPKPTLSMAKQATSFEARVSAGTEKDAPNLVLCEMEGLSPEVAEVLLEYNEEKKQVMDLVGRSGTRNAKRLSIVAAPSLVKCAAEGMLPLSMSTWYNLPSSPNFGECQINVPPRPLEKWKEVSGRKNVSVEREYDGEESNEYYQMLLNRPTAFQVSVDKGQGKLVVCMNPYVAAHRAAANLGGENASSLDVDFCLSELSSMREPDTKVFHVPNSDAYEPTPVPGMKLPLYKRQAKALTRMMAIEKGDVLFSEEERSEHILSGIGWCLIARAAKKSPLRGGVLGDAIGSGKTAITIGLIMAGVKKARASRNMKTGRSSATLVVVPPGLVQQWDDERKKFTGDELNCIIIDCVATLKKFTVEELCTADVVIVPAGIIEEAPKAGKRRLYTEHLSQKAGAGEIPPAPQGYSQREAPTIEGTWVRNMASGPEIYVGNKGNQRTRDAQAYYGHCYSEAIAKLRGKTFTAKDKGVPIEYFTWERIVIDECHETLVTGKQGECKDGDFKEKARRGAREFLGVAQTDIAKRPLKAAAGVWGLTGTPLLETEARVTELANLMGGTYLTGAAHHWRKEERESGRDLFLNQQDAVFSRENRCAVQEACHSYVKEACQRNRGEKLNVSLTREQICVNMSKAEGMAFLKKTADVQANSYGINPDSLGDKTGDVLSITASSEARHGALLEKIKHIQEAESGTKIIVFANSSFGGYAGALKALQASGKPFCEISDNHSVQEQNEIISWFRHVDATEEDRARPRVILLSFEQAAGHNLQEACHNVIIYDPMYSGSDAVADASVEEQAVGRVMRQGQKHNVTVTRLVVKGPEGERCLDDWIIERNLDPDVLAAATSNFD